MLQLQSVSKSFVPSVPVLSGIDLDVATGEILCLLGPSGCGKSTLLRIIAGLEKPDHGLIRYDEQNLAGVPVHDRQFGLMFQDYALFPHRTAGQNVAFGLRMAGWADSQIRQRVAEMLELVNLHGYDDRSIFELSGGEQQRVALARSLAPNPRLLMLDEPLGSLDRALREELMNELRAILKKMNVTALYVTHDQEEAYAVADRLALMFNGRLVQTGSPQDVYHHPNSGAVARFLGFTNLFTSTVDSTARVVDGPLGVWPLLQPVKPGRYELLIPPDSARFDCPTEQNVTPEERLSCAHNTTTHVEFKGRIGKISFRGSMCHLVVLIEEESHNQLSMQFEVPTQQMYRAPQDLSIDKKISLWIDRTQTALLPPSVDS